MGVGAAPAGSPPAPVGRSAGENAGTLGAPWAAARMVAAPRPRDEHRIEISAEELAIVHAAQAARDGTAALEPAKAAEVTARVLEDRMLFREGVRMGLDQGDPIIEQRVVQKVLLLAESLGGATREPSAAELRAAYDRGLRDPARYRQPPRYHVMHVFAARREDLPGGDLDPGALPTAGEPFPLPRETRATADELRRAYGAGFADAVVRLAPPSRYSEPIASSFGWHRVRLVDVAPGGALPFEAVERQIAFDLALQRRQDAIDLVEAWIDPATGNVQEQIVRRTAPAGGAATSCQSFLLNPAGGTATFHAGSPSFYYTRVLQTPTSRWSVFDCQRAPGANPTDCAPGGKLNVQIAERAWTSPIWYLP